MTTPHNCPTCACRPSPRTCWTCAWNDKIEGAPCTSTTDDDDAEDWYIEHGCNDDDLPVTCAADAPPCPGFKEREEGT